MMDNQQILQVHLLGNCSITYGDKSIDDSNYRVKKPWILLEYLITFRNREVPIEDLVELMYPGDQGANPLGALKTLVYRVRTLLEELDYPEARDIILVERSSYAWNNAVPIIVDADQFEQACQHANVPWLSPDEKLAACMSAIDLYEGDYLAKNMGENWVRPLSTYYHKLFVHVAQTAIDLLTTEERWEAVVDICTRAIAFDAYVESFYYHMIRALGRTGQTKRALALYKVMNSIFYTELGIAPSVELASLYREITQAGGPHGETDDLPTAKHFLLQDDRATGAFFCDLAVFKDIYTLEARSAARYQRKLFLCMLSLRMPDKSVPPFKLLNTCMEKLGECIQNTLRRGDLVAKYSMSQYILLLPTDSAENGAVALRRVIGRFNELYPRCPMELLPAVQAIDMVG